MLADKISLAKLVFVDRAQPASVFGVSVNFTKTEFAAAKRAIHIRAARRDPWNFKETGAVAYRRPPYFQGGLLPRP